MSENQNNRMLRNGMPSKMKFLQSYEVLWIHWCELDCICIGIDITLELR